MLLLNNIYFSSLFHDMIKYIVRYKHNFNHKFVFYNNE